MKTTNRLTETQARALRFADTAGAVSIRTIAEGAGYTFRNNQPAYDFVWRLIGRGLLAAKQINGSRYEVTITDAGRAMIA